MPNRTAYFGVIGAEHAHVYGIFNDLLDVGAVCRGWWNRGEPETANGTIDPFPGVPRLDDYRRLLDDPEIDLIVVAAIPSDRAQISIEAMQSGKDVVSDKPGVITFNDLNKLRDTAAQTGRFWSINFSERYRVRAALKATELVREGAIGKVLQTVGLGPHRGLVSRRRPWFFERKKSGGIICDIGAHQIDNFVHFTGSTEAEVRNSSVGNFTRPVLSEFEEFGEILLRGDGGLGYARVDWLTPDDQPNPGDSRLTILGSDGTIEIRKYVDIAGRPGANHLFLVRGGEMQYVDCSNVPLTYFSNIVADIRNRSHTAEPAGHSLLVSELAIQAQRQATKLGSLAS